MNNEKIWVNGEVITAEDLNRLEKRVSESGGDTNELWGKSFQNRGRADGKNIDDLMNNENQGQWWVEVSKVQGTHAFDSGYYFLICYSNVQIAIKFVSSDTTPRPIKYRYYTNNKWYGWSNNCSSNPNLLINGDFQVNQRGSTTYEIPSSTWNTIYTVDRWALTGQGTKATYNNNKVTVVSNSNDSYLRQIFEKPLNGTYIATVKVTSLTGNASCYMRDNNQVSYGAKALSVGINHIEISGSNLNELMIMISANSTITIEYVKLEQGSIATPFIPRLYAEELALCQRYYQILNMQSAILYSYPDKSYMARVNFESMRIVPTIEYFKGTSYNSSDLDIYTHNYSIIATYQGEEKADCLTLRVNLANTPKSGCYGIVITMRLDAEIY